ncbi:hypothetical protein H6G54_07960 [Anabaena cylindrica FACHB-243]|uniref:DUF5615 domain-containing protein n=1 Tax=Anabaena cylindrica (strain ATCC 27899 / PCC 7122) TaxID=272123 RepID=K9ZNE4_ANACC|nr:MULTISPECIES: hypothetical protein [Anabaena]AFZ60309.1 hypothetical protein Anacy_4969 [Anabaena cylindrica PCC 7122]MBD2417639.1 hypothetical protein [Anabaena cylindrica FACHB-243]MBY5282032.1 hypothetical protein [Anabaena sp. CCAP 1446/1C]MBY5308870.1 hypothetical protein [Anabaena sp. CCAP 1446/1C]MCM2404554.1 hypothetical protein [Anabaena sp. CCAP 1446/1C]
MTRFLADENFNNQIVRGVLCQAPDIDIVRVQDVDLSGVDDPYISFPVSDWECKQEALPLLYMEGRAF